ncbi:MAG: Gfo/Idh/MocA family protein, partial [Planctomycetota bacterium]
MKDHLRIGIVGTGNRGIHCFGHHFDRRDDCTLAALCDTNPVRMKLMAEKLDANPAQYTVLAEMLETEQLDAIVVTTPDCYHAEVVLEALEAGVDCLVDKPLATTVVDAKRVIDTAERTGKMVLMGF